MILLNMPLWVQRRVIKMTDNLKKNLIAALIVGLFMLGISIYPIWTIRIFFTFGLICLVRLLLDFTIFYNK